MDKFDRFQLLHRTFLSHRFPISITALADKLECSPRTVKRTIEGMRDYLGAPIVWDPIRRGWHYDTNENDTFELPGLWMTAGELQSLTLLSTLIRDLGHGLLGEEMAAIEEKVEAIQRARGIEPSEFSNRLKLIPLGHRQIPNLQFAHALEGCVKRLRMELIYVDYQNKESVRLISPQTLVYYRQNWYLNAWCHKKHGMRTFAIARIEKLTLFDIPALDRPDETLVQQFREGYGIFEGEASHYVKLLFHPRIAREISSQYWHPGQKGFSSDENGEAQKDGLFYVLEFNYTESTELIRDIMSHLPDVTVLEPVSLRQQLVETLATAMAHHQCPGSQP